MAKKAKLMFTSLTSPDSPESISAKDAKKTKRKGFTSTDTGA